MNENSHDDVVETDAFKIAGFVLNARVKNRLLTEPPKKGCEKWHKLRKAKKKVKRLTAQLKDQSPSEQTRVLNDAIERIVDRKREVSRQKRSHEDSGRRKRKRKKIKHLDPITESQEALCMESRDSQEIPEQKEPQDDAAAQNSSDGNADARITRKEKKTHKVKRSGISKRIIKDVASMAALLRNELQRPYHPEEGKNLVDSVCRKAGDHLGRQMKKGLFTNEENKILRARILDYFNQQGWSQEEGWSCLRPSSHSLRSEAAKHWGCIATCLPQRSIRSIRQHAQKSIIPWKGGPWTPEEEANLVDLVRQHGHKWSLFSKEYFRRTPDRIQMKWKELEPTVVLSKGKYPIKRIRVNWTEKEDVKLLTEVRLAAGVALPFRSIPWHEVQRKMPNFTKDQLSQRYRFILFPSILGTYYKGATQLVVLRQFVRYLRRGIEANVIHDMSEVEMRRVVPFWYSMDHARRLTLVLKHKCPAEIQQATFAEQIGYLYNLLKCGEKEQDDLRRLAKTFKILQKINGVALITQRRRVLSEMYRQPFDIISNDQSNRESEIPDFSKEFELNLFENVSVSQSNSVKSGRSILGPVASTFKNLKLDRNSLGELNDDRMDGEQQQVNKQNEQVRKQNDKKNKKNKKIFIPPTDSIDESVGKIIRPMNASVERIQSVVPPGYQEVPEAFPLYLSMARSRADAEREHDDSKERDRRALKHANRAGANQMDYMDYHLYSSLGLTDIDDSAMDYLLKRGIDNGDEEANDDDDEMIEFWDTLEQITDLAEEAPDQNSDIEMDKQLTVTSIPSQEKGKNHGNKSILIGGTRFSKKNHPWML